MGPLALHIIIPAIDKYMGEDPENPPEEAVTDLENDSYYARVVKLFIPLQIIANLYGNYLVSQKQFHWKSVFFLAIFLVWSMV